MRLHAVCFGLLGLVLTAAVVRTQSPKAVIVPVCRPMIGQWPMMCLTPVDATPLGNRIPVVLIHGWTQQNGPDLPEWATWQNLLSYLSAIPWVAEKYKGYQLSYLSNQVSVSEIARITALLIDDTDVRDPAFAKQKMVMIGYSMGGLVARSFMQEQRLQGGRGMSGGDRVLRLLTLATPHHGTPVANGPARNAKAGFLVGNLINAFDNVQFRGLTWTDQNRSDLRDDGIYRYLDFNRFPSDRNDWLLNLNSSFGQPNQQKTTPFAGEVNLTDSVKKCFSTDSRLDCLAPMIGDTLGVRQNDGVVPLDSAGFRDCANCPGGLKFFGYNHQEIVTGKSTRDSNLFGAILGVLSDLVSAGDLRFDANAILGNSASEAFHNLRGWGLAQSTSQGTSRYQLIGDRNSVDLFISKPLTSQRLSFQVENGLCDDSWELWVGDALITTHQHKSPTPLSTVTMVVDGKYFPQRRVTVTFVNKAKDTCGRAAVHSVKLF